MVKQCAMLPYRLHSGFLKVVETAALTKFLRILAIQIITCFYNIMVGVAADFCIALEISSSRNISGWVIGRFHQHHIF
jgi:hypothetical protein